MAAKTDYGAVAQTMDRDTMEPAGQQPPRVGSKMCFGCGCCPYSIPSGQVGMLENCGESQKTVQPGLVCLMCCFEAARLPLGLEDEG